MSASPSALPARHLDVRHAVAVCVGMVVGALLMTRYADRSNTGMWMALHYVPIALLALAFSLQELAQFEIPPLPRRSKAPRWGGADNAAPVQAEPAA